MTKNNTSPCAADGKSFMQLRNYAKYVLPHTASPVSPASRQLYWILAGVMDDHKTRAFVLGKLASPRKASRCVAPAESGRARTGSRHRRDKSALHVLQVDEQVKDNYHTTARQRLLDAEVYRAQSRRIFCSNSRARQPRCYWIAFAGVGNSRCLASTQQRTSIPAPQPMNQKV